MGIYETLNSKDSPQLTNAKFCITSVLHLLFIDYCIHRTTFNYMFVPIKSYVCGHFWCSMIPSAIVYVCLPDADVTYSWPIGGAGVSRR